MLTECTDLNLLGLALVSDRQSSPMGRCYQCGINTPEQRLASVGDGQFCPQCFELLFVGAPDPLATEASPAPYGTEDGSPQPEGHGGGASCRCLVCEESADRRDSVEFLGRMLCAACVVEMNRELEAAERAEQSTSAADSRLDRTQEERGDSSIAASNDAHEAGVVFTPGAQTVLCAGCERPMPGPGSYRVLAGNRYCPACVPFYARQEGLPPAEVVASQVPVVTDDSSAESCDCCSRPMRSTANEVWGFRLCSACFSSDAKLASAIASARHRRRLERLYRSLKKPRGTP